ncbi:hypothetical protein G6031_03215 [Dietzia sp. CQ4]|uniref:hypothetical protein n=1 Tax=Dietzia sp. (strain CQ4) TaxID=370437 RepID=UPI0015FE22B0|nr:hypothetical protein [Dietzia sp. CQ4]MBB1033400.1 hypothetical protein [Dietzia sp. CQ4]
MNFTYTGIESSPSSWRIAGDGEGREGVVVVAEGLEGLVAEVKVHTEPAAAATGMRPLGFDVEEMNGTLSYLVGDDFLAADSGLGYGPDVVDAIYRRWRAAWTLNPLHPAGGGLLTAHAPGKPALSTRVRATKMPGPERSPDAPSGDWVAGEMDIVSDSGIWVGEDEPVAPGRVWRNSGDLPVYPQIHWTGSGKSFTPPGLSTPVALPSTSTPLVLDTDPATGGVIRADTPGGALDHPAWRAMRGRRVPRPVEIGGTTDGWVLGGCTMSCRVLVIDPWAW